MHLFGIITFHKVGRPAAASEKLLQFFMLDAGQHGRVANLVAIEVQDRQHGSVGNWVEQLVGLPGGRQGARFRFAVADDAGDDQIGIVERRTEGMAERVPQLAAFVNRTRRRRRNMAGNPAGKRELLEQLFQPGFVLRDVRINFTPGAFEVDIAHNCRAAVTGTGDVEHVQVILLDDPVQMHIDEVLARRRAPVSDHQRLHVRQLQRLLQQRIVVEINLADREIVGGTPIGVDLAKQLGRKWTVSVEWFQPVVVSLEYRVPLGRLTWFVPLGRLDSVLLMRLLSFCEMMLRENKKADANEHQRCSNASAYSVTGRPALGGITL